MQSERVSKLITKAGRKFEVVRAAQLNDHLPMAVYLKSTSSSGSSKETRRTKTKMYL